MDKPPKENIKWIKNVKSKSGGWAYEDKLKDEVFKLHWPSSKPGSAQTPSQGDIIVLFQKPEQINGFSNKEVFLTHLVVPIDDKVRSDNQRPDYNVCRYVRLIAKADPINAIPNPGYYNFFKPNRGLTNPIKNLTYTGIARNFDLRDDIWKLFENNDGIISNDLNSNENEFGALEGDKIMRDHLLKEITLRDSKIVHQKKQHALNLGRLNCECCGFDFFKTYGLVGYGFVECHHITPLHKGKRKTQLSDLALVCSNCHRMLHRKFENGYHTIDSLKSAISIKKEKVSCSD